MAKENRKKKMKQSPNPQGSINGEKKQNGFLFSVLALIAALVIIVAVLGGAFYIVIRNNVNGLAERYRKEIQAIPVLKHALPVPPDPEDPQYMTAAEIKDRYQELRKLRDELKAQLEEAGKKIEELRKYKDEQDRITAENERVRESLERQRLEIEEKIKRYEEDKKKLDEAIAQNDRDGFTEFFERIDRENAEAIYAQVIKEQKAKEEDVKFAKLYEAMDADAAARIFEQLGSSKIDLVVEALKNMNREAASEILASMDPAYAAKVTEKLKGDE